LSYWSSDIVKFNASSIIIHRDIYLDDCQIRKLKEPNADDDAAAKRYVVHSINAVVDRASIMLDSLDMERYSIMLQLRDMYIGILQAMQT
jgi:hypothetical protein